MSHWSFTLYGVDQDAVATMITPDTPVYGEGEISYLYTVHYDEDNATRCIFKFKTHQEMVAHREQTNNIKSEASEADRRRFAAGITTPDISFWLNFLVLVRRFKNEWGTDYVPKDIQDATTDVETVHGVALTFPN
jgi:hypothetical protein